MDTPLDFTTFKLQIDILIQELIQQKDELYAELSRLQKADDELLDSLENKNQELEDIIKKTFGKLTK